MAFDDAVYFWGKMQEAQDIDESDEQRAVFCLRIVAYLGGISARHVCDKVYDAAGVAPLVIVPRNEFHKVIVQRDSRLCVED